MKKIVVSIVSLFAVVGLAVAVNTSTSVSSHSTPGLVDEINAAITNILNSTQSGTVTTATNNANYLITFSPVFIATPDVIVHVKGAGTTNVAYTVASNTLTVAVGDTTNFVWMARGRVK